MCCDTKQDDVEKQRERVKAVIADLASKKEAGEVFAKEKELKQQFAEEYQKDFDGFAFKCQRWGEFLSLQIKRVDRYHATAINLPLVKDIQLTEGRAPDNDGVLEYFAGPIRNEDKDGGHTYYNFYSGYESDGKLLVIKKGWMWKVFPQYPYLPSERPLFKIQQDAVTTYATNTSTGYMICTSNASTSYNHSRPEYSHPVERVTPNFPRAAVDDQIYFSGLGATVYAPAGRGAEVLQCILQEISKGKDNGKEA